MKQWARQTNCDIMAKCAMLGMVQTTSYICTSSMLRSWWCGKVGSSSRSFTWEDVTLERYAEQPQVHLQLLYMAVTLSRIPYRYILQVDLCEGLNFLLHGTQCNLKFGRHLNWYLAICQCYFTVWTSKSRHESLKWFKLQEIQTQRAMCGNVFAGWNTNQQYDFKG